MSQSDIRIFFQVTNSNTTKDISGINIKERQALCSPENASYAISSKTISPTSKTSCPNCKFTFAKPQLLKQHLNRRICIKVFSCPMCPKTFRAFSGLTQHAQSHTHEKPHKCYICAKSFRAKATLYYHLRSQHTMERPYNCPHCPMTFAAEKCQNRHMLRIHTIPEDRPKPSTKKYSCPNCDKKFSAKFSIKMHIRRACPKGQYKLTKPDGMQCTFCNDFLPSKRLLQIHKVQSHPEVDLKPFACSKCNNRFQRKSSLSYHMKQIHPEKVEIHTCPHCGNEFSNKLKLDRHIQIHTNPDRFKCEFCPKAFPRSDQLHIHLRTHTDERNYECSLCPKKLRTGPALKRHMLTHTGELQFKCTWSNCSANFGHLQSLKNHRNKVHLAENVPKPFVCDIVGCRKSFPFQGNLTVHKKTHSELKLYQCNLCEYKCRTNWFLKAHMHGVHFEGPRVFECTFGNCSKTFKDKNNICRHVLRHTLEKKDKVLFLRTKV